MTAVLAIDLMYQILVMADCRVSWIPPVHQPQDNLLKIYPIGPTGIFGFSGSVQAAKVVFTEFADWARNIPLPPSASDIVSDIAQSARQSYSQLPDAHKLNLELMYVAPDYGNVTLRTENVTFARNLMIRMESPSFLPTPQSTAVRLGYARKYPMDILRQNRNSLLNEGLTPEGRRFQIGITIGGLVPTLARYAPHQVGGLFSIAVATASGVGFWPYGPVDGLELAIESGGFVQIDHNDGRRVRLESIVDYDPTEPYAGNLVFRTPSV